MKNLIKIIALSLLLVPSLIFAQSEIDEVLMVSDNWTVLKSISEDVFNRESCQAQTVSQSTKNQEDALVTLKVMNVKNSVTNEYNEPLVLLTVESSQADLSQMLTMSLRASNDRVDYDMELLADLSDLTKRVFISRIGDRGDLINKIAAKNTITAKFFKGVSLIDSVSLSLKGSSKAVKGKSNSDASLKNRCGGISILAGI